MKNFFKNIIACVILFLASHVNAQKEIIFNDIDGCWQRGSYIIYASPGHYGLAYRASYQNFLNDQMPKKLLGHNIFDEITYEGNGVWKTDSNWQWVYSGDMENGRWEDRGPVRLTMSVDKQSFSDGNRTFNRVNCYR